MKELVQMPFFNNLNVLVYFEHAVSLWSDKSGYGLVWLAKKQNIKYSQKHNPLLSKL